MDTPDNKSISTISLGSPDSESLKNFHENFESFKKVLFELLFSSENSIIADESFKILAEHIKNSKPVSSSLEEKEKLASITESYSRAEERLAMAEKLREESQFQKIKNAKEKVAFALQLLEIKALIDKDPDLQKMILLLMDGNPRPPINSRFDPENN